MKQKRFVTLLGTLLWKLLGLLGPLLGALLGAAAWYADRDAARAVAWDALEAVLALVVRDLVGQHGLTQEHYDTLVGPWESVMGTEWTRETL